MSPAPHLECRWQDLNLVEQGCLRVKEKAGLRTAPYTANLITQAYLTR